MKIISFMIAMAISVCCLGQKKDTSSVKFKIVGGKFDRRTIGYVPVTYTQNIPICPYCQQPTYRWNDGDPVTQTIYSGGSYFTKRYYYDEEGNLTNPDYIETTTYWECSFCRNKYSVVIDYKKARYE